MTPVPAPSWRRTRGAAVSLALCLALGISTLAVAPAGAVLDAGADTTSADATGTVEPDATLTSALAAITAESGDDHATPDGDPEVSLLLRDLWLDRGEFTGSQRRLARSLLARPTSSVAHRAWRYPEGTVPEQRCGEWVCVTSVRTGRHIATEQWIEETLRLVEAAWSKIVDDLGYRAPAPDGEGGGDQRFDVYLADLSAGDYGFCAPESPVPGQAGRASSYCVLDNDMAGFGQAPLKSLAATAAHEFFHAVQFNYDVAEDRWFMEASATWAEEQVFDEVDDNRQFLKKGQLGDPLTPLDSTRTMYGNWIFVQWLSRQHGTDAVRQVWERLDASVGSRNEWSLQAVSRLVASRGESWPHFFAGFARANALPGSHYDEGRAYRAAPVHDRLRLGVRRPARTRNAALPHLTSRSMKVTWRPTDARRRTVLLRMHGTRPAHTQAQVLLHRPDGTISVRQAPLGPKGRAKVRIAAPQRVRRLVVVFSHTAVTYRRCGNDSGWSCGGQPVGDLGVTVTARLVR